MFNRVDNVVDFNDASTTLQNVAQTATPLFASTIKPAAFMEGILLGGFLVAAVAGAVYLAVTRLFTGRRDETWKFDYKGRLLPRSLQGPPPREW